MWIIPLNTQQSNKKTSAYGVNIKHQFNIDILVKIFSSRLFIFPPNNFWKLEKEYQQKKKLKVKGDHKGNWALFLWSTIDTKEGPKLLLPQNLIFFFPKKVWLGKNIAISGPVLENSSTVIQFFLCRYSKFIVYIIKIYQELANWGIMANIYYIYE